MRTNIEKSMVTTLKVFKQYPLVILSALVAAVLMIYQQNMDYISDDTLREAQKELKRLLDRLTIVSVLGISLFYAINTAIQRYNWNRWISLIGVLILIGAYYFVDTSLYDSIYMLKYLILGLIFHLSVSFIGFIQDNDEAGFWEFNKKLFVNAVLTGIFTAVLVGGVMLAIGGLDNLFDLDIDSDLYFNTFTFLSVVGSVVIFLHFGKEGIVSMKDPDPYPIVLKFFTQFILIPLLIIYGLILYAYMGKIIIQWELPRGWVTYLVNAYSIFGILALLLVHPLKEVTERSWVKIFSNIFYYSLLPLVILMGIGIYTRINAYGVTEARYYVVLLTLWIFFIALYFIIRKQAKIRVIPVTLSVVLLLSIILPGVNAFSCAEHSQINRFKTILTENTLLAEGKIDYDAVVDEKEVRELESILYYLKERKKLDKVGEYFTEKDMESIEENSKYSRVFSTKFKNKVINSSKDGENGVTKGTIENITISTYNDYSIERKNIYEVGDYDYVVPEVSQYARHKVDIDGKELWLTPNNMEDYNNRKFMVTLKEGDVVIDGTNIQPLLKSYVEGKLDTFGVGRIVVDEIKFEFPIGDYHCKYLLHEINLYRNGNLEDEINNIDFKGTLFVRRREG